jgi:uncharacterized protein (TIGR02246 family)
MQRMIAAAIGLTWAAIPPVFADTLPPQAACEPVTEPQVAALFDRWNQSLATKDADKVVANYTKEGTLLPTVKDGPLIGAEHIKSYFVTFLKQSPRGKIDRHVIHIGCNVAYDIGLYTFEVDGPASGSRREIKARYSFVYVLEQGKWLIAHHHSSKLPE